jgi:hypothetical protein
MTVTTPDGRRVTQSILRQKILGEIKNHSNFEFIDGHHYFMMFGTHLHQSPPPTSHRVQTREKKVKKEETGP